MIHRMMECYLVVPIASPRLISSIPSDAEGDGVDDEKYVASHCDGNEAESDVVQVACHIVQVLCHPNELVRVAETTERTLWLFSHI